jgi:uncharacterized protein YifE (UPF0438 family)
MSGETPRMPTQADIAERAYQIFERRNHQHGYDVSDWTLAEQELYQEFRQSVKAMNSKKEEPTSQAPQAKKKSA